MICSECDHHFGLHEWPNGCLAGWEYNTPGAEGALASNEGCECKLAHVDYSIDERSRR